MEREVAGEVAGAVADQVAGEVAGEVEGAVADESEVAHVAEETRKQVIWQLSC